MIKTMTKSNLKKRFVWLSCPSHSPSVGGVRAGTQMGIWRQKLPLRCEEISVRSNHREKRLAVHNRRKGMRIGDLAPRRQELVARLALSQQMHLLMPLGSLGEEY